MSPPNQVGAVLHVNTVVQEEEEEVEYVIAVITTDHRVAVMSSRHSLSPP